MSESDPDDDHVLTVEALCQMTDSGLGRIEYNKIFDDLDDGVLDYLDSRKKALKRITRKALDVRLATREQLRQVRERARQAEEQLRQGQIRLSEALKLRRLESIFKGRAPGSTARRGSVWALEYITFSEWSLADFDEEVVESLGQSVMSRQRISTDIFSTTQVSLNIKSNEPEAKQALQRVVIFPLMLLHPVIAEYPPISCRLERNNGIGSLYDIIVEADSEIRTEPGEPLFVIEGKMPHQIVGVDTTQADSRKQMAKPSTALLRESFRESLKQLFTYMVFNGLKYGVLSSFEFSYFVKRDNKGNIWVTQPFSALETGTDSYTGTLKAYASLIYKVFKDPDSRNFYPDENEQLEKAFVAYCAEKFGRDRIFGANPSPMLLILGDNAVEFFARIRSTLPRNGAREAEDLESLRSAIMDHLPLEEKNFSMPLPWSKEYKNVGNGVCRIPGFGNHPDAWGIYVKTFAPTNKDRPLEFCEFEKQNFLKEVELYNGPLRQLQGLYVPFLIYGGTFCEREIIATSDSGKTASRDLAIANYDWFPVAIRESLQQVHAANVLHGDIAWRNIAIDPLAKRAHLVDFGRGCSGDDATPERKREEVEYLDKLLRRVAKRKRIRDSLRRFPSK